MAAKGTKRGRGKAAAKSGIDAPPEEAAPEASASPAETEASEPTSSPEAPLPDDEGRVPDEAEPDRARAAFETSEPRTGETEVSAVRDGSYWVATGLAAVLLAVMVVGIWFLARGDSGRLDQQAQRLDAFSNQVQTQTSRLDAAEEAISGLRSEVSQMGSSVSELQATAEANRQSLERITQNIENLASAGDGAIAAEAVGELQDTLQSLDARLASLEQGADLDDLTGRVSRLEEEIAGWREQEAQRVAQAEAASALGRAYAALTQQISAGEPFAEELEAVSAELPNAPGLETLRPIAGEGAPTVLQLQLRLEEIAAGLPQPEPDDGAAEGDGFLETMGQRLQGMVTVRRADEADMPGALDRALQALQRNDVAAAIAEIEQVSEAPPEEIESWLADARKRRDAQAGPR
jgi:hypothetical protein